MITSSAVDSAAFGFLRKRESVIICLAVFLAACRIFLFNAAFPFFNNVDEHLHFDMVYKYGAGDPPQQGELDFSPGSAELIVMFGTQEYTATREQFPGGRFPPPLWTVPRAKQTKYFRTWAGFWGNYKNWEVWQFRLPYILEGAWYRVGEAFGMKGGHLLYWMRFLNIPVFALLVWLSWLTAKKLFPDDPLMRLGVPLLLAFFPQDAFYAITNDTFSALFCGLAFLLLIQLYFEDKPIYYHAAAGLSVAAAFLAKVSNIALPVLFVLVAVSYIKTLRAQERLRAYAPRLVVLCLSACIPVGALFLRNYLVLGDLTGTSDAINLFGWQVKSLGDLTDHPIFTLRGLCYFLSELTKSFWRGEFTWHAERMAHGWADALYIFTTALFLSLSLYSLFSRDMTSRRRFALLASFIVLIVSVLFLAFSSIRYDFGDWPFPSRETPFFSQGRLLSGVTIPFLILYVSGLQVLFAGPRKHLHPILIVLAIVICMSVSEICLTLPVFESPFNWFHLISSPAT